VPIPDPLAAEQRLASAYHVYTILYNCWIIFVKSACVSYWVIAMVATNPIVELFKLLNHICDAIPSQLLCDTGLIDLLVIGEEVGLAKATELGKLLGEDAREMWFNWEMVDSEWQVTASRWCMSPRRSHSLHRHLSVGSTFPWLNRQLNSFRPSHPLPFYLSFPPSSHTHTHIQFGLRKWSSRAGSYLWLVRIC